MNAYEADAPDTHPDQTGVEEVPAQASHQVVPPDEAIAPDGHNHMSADEEVPLGDIPQMEGYPAEVEAPLGQPLTEGGVYSEPRHTAEPQADALLNEEPAPDQVAEPRERFVGVPGTSYILIVDDDEGVLAMSSAILESAGFKSVTAVSGEEGLQVYEDSMQQGWNVSMVLLDLTLPGGMSGMDTLDRLLNVNPQVRTVATSGYFDESAADAARARGFVGILPKPFTAERLTRIVQWGVGKQEAA